MSYLSARPDLAMRIVGLAAAVGVFAPPALAQTPNTTQANVNVANLLSPFFSLNSTTVGQTTLNLNLADAVATNQFAAANPTVAAIAISDKAIFSGNSTSISPQSATATKAYGPGANLGGGLPVQTVQTPGTIAPAQTFGGLGSLGTAYQTAVAPVGGTVPSLVTLLNSAYNFTSSDLGLAKNYFANGTIDGVRTAIAPTGAPLPTANGYPNTLTSVYDTAYGVSNTQPGQGIYGDSRPVQVTSALTPFDPTALLGLTTNPAFPSGHTNYAFTDSILIGMAAPQFFQSMLLRASEYGQSREELGVHYALDVIGSRAFASYDLAQLLNGTNPAYQQTNAATGAVPLNLNTQFQAAATGLNTYLNTQTGVCGGSLASCAATNPYNTFSAATYGSQPFVTSPGTTTSSTNSAIYTARLTLGLPTLTFTQAPRETAPAGGPDASILLATLYGGSTAAAQSLAASAGGALNGNLSTPTINQIILNTENNALAAFYGTSLSYWTRINLYAAAGYFQGVTGPLTLAAGDQIKTDVTVSATGRLAGSGAIAGNLLFQAGSTLATQANGTAATAPLVVGGTTILQPGTTVSVAGTVLPGLNYKLVSGTGAVGVVPGVMVDTSQTSGLGPVLTGTLVVAADPGLSVRLQSNFGAYGATRNQRNVATAIDAGGNAGGYGVNGATLLGTIIQNNTTATLPATFDRLSGEGIAGQQQAVLNATELFASTVLDAARGGLSSDSISQAGPRRVWLTGFGQSANLDANANAGSASWSDTLAGFAVGTDYRFDSGLTVGVASGYSDAQFSVNARNTHGHSSAGHVALYGVERVGDTYLTAVLDAGFFHNTTGRLALDSSQNGSFSSTEVLGRVEGGQTFHFAPGNVTPFASFQAASLSNDGFSETGGGTSGLHVNSRTVSSDKIALGAQLETTRSFAGGTQLTPYARLAWEHEFNTSRRIGASLVSLPGSGFTVSGAPAVSDAARVVAGAKLDITNMVAVYAAFDGAFSGSGNFYSGKGGIRIAW